MVALRRTHRDDVVRITTAPQTPGEEIAHRQRRYMISMGIRTACFVGAILVGGGWVRWVLVAAAFVLPYVAVVMANSASPRVEGAALPDTGPMHPELGPGQSEPPA
jgi:Flp pilus assembly protein TadB